MRVTRALVVFVSCIVLAAAQEPGVPELKGLRLYGRSRADLPVTTLRSEPLTVEFDIQADQPPNLQLRFLHCDRNWNTTSTGFVNDEFHNKTRTELPFVTAPLGIRGYSYRYTISIPDERVFKGFLFSGNYVLEIADLDREEVLARARFFVADTILRPVMKVANRQEPSEINPYYQVNRIDVSFRIPPPDSSGGGVSYFPLDFSSVEVYKNRELFRPWRIDADDDNPHTFVEGFGTQSLTFRIDNVPPGNEYRTLNLENVDFYPQDRLVRARGGADLSRFLGKVVRDNNGASFPVEGTRFAEYLDFEFELLWDQPSDSVFVVGDFNFWSPGFSSPMRYEDGRYRWKTALRRGRYD